MLIASVLLGPACSSDDDASAAADASAAGGSTIAVDAATAAIDTAGAADAVADVALPGEDIPGAGDPDVPVSSPDVSGVDEGPPDPGVVPAAPANLPDGVELLLTGVTLQLVDGLSPGVVVDVPENTISVTVTIEGPDADMFTVASWIGPDGYKNVTPGWYTYQPQICITCNNRVQGAVEGVSAALAPIQPEGRVDPGLHNIAVYGSRMVGNNPFSQTTEPSDGEVLVRVHAKVREEPPETGVLDLNLHFTGARGWTADTALADPAFATIMDTVRQFYGAVGIELGTLNTFDIDPAFAVIESIMGAGNELNELFATSAGRPENAVNLFFVDEFTGGPMGGMGVVLGVSGGIPGPVLTHGTVRSGVAIAARVIPGAPAGVDTTVAHELGHYLGLFHTSEVYFGFGPELHDPLPDTPENDQSYLMFNTGSGSKLSPLQGQVMRSSPWVRHPEESP